MEPISDIDFDLVIAGTGLPQSLLALALSRSDKKILHVDRNGYYGGAEAALSLQEAEEWVESNSSSEFRNANIQIPERSDALTPSEDFPKLGFSRAYSLTLSPQIIYSRSALLPTLVSSRVYRQLEFLAVGAWWIYEKDEAIPEGDTAYRGCLHKVPGGREDVFADKKIGLKTKRLLMKFLKFISDADAQAEALELWGSKPFAEFLTKQHGIPVQLQATLHALTLSPDPPDRTKTSYAIPRITRHLTSIGVFGPGFGSVIPKWGGVADIAQVACRAGAVGGGIYMLGRNVESIVATNGKNGTEDLFTIDLSSKEAVRSRSVAGRKTDLPDEVNRQPRAPDVYVARSISIVASTLGELFPPIADGAPPSACTVVVFPVGSMHNGDNCLDVPIYLMIHSSDTGECPANQSVIYSSISLGGEIGRGWLQLAVNTFLKALKTEKNTDILWELSFDQLNSPSSDLDRPTDVSVESIEKTFLFPTSNTDLAFDDSVLRDVRSAWQSISGDTDGFMQFEDREVGAYDDEDE